MSKYLLVKFDHIKAENDNLYDLITSFFKFKFDKNRHLIIKSKLFKNYVIQEIKSTHSYSMSYTLEEAIKDYISNGLCKKLVQYNIKIYKVYA